MDQATIVWHHHYANGPINGLAVYQGESFWFAMQGDITQADLSNDPPERTFGLYRLTEKQLTMLTEEHARFRREVGYCRDHDPKLWRPSFHTAKSYFSPINPMQLESELVHTIKQAQCINYLQRRALPDD